MNVQKIMLVTLVLAIAIATPVLALVGPDVKIISSKLNQPIKPGEESILTIQLSNLGQFKCAYKIVMQIQVNPPISFEGTDSQIIEKICSPETASVSFTLKADENAESGNYPMNVITTYQSEYSTTYSSTNVVYAEVRGETKLRAHVTKAMPLTPYPGDDFAVEVTIDNVGTHKAEGLVLELSTDSPLSVKPSSRTQTIAVLSPSSSATKVFYLDASKQANPGKYELMLKATYKGENGEIKSKEIPLEITLSPKARFEASNGNSVSYIDSRDNELRFKLKNVGTEEARKVRVKLLPAFPFSTKGSVQYIESIKPGEEKEISFYVNIDKEGIPGQYSLDLSTYFENNKGNEFRETIPVSTRIDYAPVLQTLFLSYWYAWAIAFLAALAIAVKKIKSKKK